MRHFLRPICNIKTNPLNSGAGFMYRVNAGLSDVNARSPEKLCAATPDIRQNPACEGQPVH
jgi:hypothetical protein